MREGVYRAINMRYESGKPLIVTTNLSKQQLLNSENIDKRRVYDRIIEMCHFIEIGGGSCRLEVAEKRTAIVDNYLGLIN